MINRSTLCFGLVVVCLVGLGGKLLLLQRQQAALLHVQLVAARFERIERDRLSAENLRLRALQIPAAELEVLRADHAALPRLRAEFEALKAP